MSAKFWRGAVSLIDPAQTVARFDSGTLDGDTLVWDSSLTVCMFHYDRRGKFLPVCDTARVHATLEKPDGTVIDTRALWCTVAEDDEEEEENEAELSTSDEEVAPDLSGSSDFEVSIDADAGGAVQEVSGELMPVWSPDESDQLSLSGPRYKHWSEISVDNLDVAGRYVLRYFVSDQLAYTQALQVGEH
jgi:hypothetical protein